jgi:hypothetical protein
VQAMTAAANPGPVPPQALAERMADVVRGVVAKCS